MSPDGGPVADDRAIAVTGDLPPRAGRAPADDDRPAPLDCERLLTNSERMITEFTSPFVVDTHRLTRAFGPLVAVNEMTLTIPRGGVVGLVGPNGSGKSTLIRMLLGLIRPTGGSAEVLGIPTTHPERYAGRVGALIESPAFLPSLSARDNLRSLGQLRGLGDDRVATVIDAVGLAGREHEPVARFSLGMKQRLGIAAALLPSPDLLILDEPTNGLDPAGIVEIRGLLRDLAAEGRTVIVSSHLLGEIQAACDMVVIIRFGAVLFSGSIGDLLARAVPHVEVAPEYPDDMDRLQATLVAAGWRVTNEGTELRVAADDDATSDINRAATSIGVTLRKLVAAQEDLEDVFLRMTGTTDGELARDRAAQARPGAEPGVLATAGAPTMRADA
jgi:ABC-2 type transport system ATP-binding protein